MLRNSLNIQITGNLPRCYDRTRTCAETRENRENYSVVTAASKIFRSLATFGIISRIGKLIFLQDNRICKGRSVGDSNETRVLVYYLHSFRGDRVSLSLENFWNSSESQKNRSEFENFVGFLFVGFRTSRLFPSNFEVYGIVRISQTFQRFVEPKNLKIFTMFG